MPVIVVTPDQLLPALQKHVQRDTQRLTPAALAACHRGVAFAVALTNQLRKVDRGSYKAGFRVVPGYTPGIPPMRPPLPAIVNDTLYAGVIELGRRPMRRGPPLAPILGWVQRKLGLSGAEADRAAFLIRRAIHIRGTRPWRIMEQTKNKVVVWFRDEYERILRQSGGT
jgi:hypothetical protein